MVFGQNRPLLLPFTTLKISDTMRQSRKSSSSSRLPLFAGLFALLRQHRRRLLALLLLTTSTTSSGVVWGFLWVARPYHHHVLSSRSSSSSLRRSQLSQLSNNVLLAASLASSSSSSLASAPSSSPSSSSTATAATATTARSIAVQALVRADDNNMAAFAIDKLESLLAASPKDVSPSTRDKSFARLLVTTCLRRQGQIEKVLALCQNQKSSEISNSNKKRRLNVVDRHVQAVLRLGAVQLLFLETPPHAAVKETVDVLRQLPKKGKNNNNHNNSASQSPSQQYLQIPKAKIKFVNAVLRRLAREGSSLLAQHTSITDNVSPWLLAELTRAWGPDAAQAIVQASMVESPRCLTLKEPEKVEEMANLFDETTILPQGSLLIKNPPPGKISSWPRYEEGDWWLQDVSATLPALALRDGLLLQQLKKDQEQSDGSRPQQQQQQEQQQQPTQPSSSFLHVVDLCAAPGGKTAQLCAMGGSSLPIGRVTAVEISQRRSLRLRENLQRLGMLKEDETTPTATNNTSINRSNGTRCEVVVADGTQWKPLHQVDGVLIDAPCTATGTGSKRPDILQKDEAACFGGEKSNDNTSSLLDTQYNLLCHAADHILKPGGILVYATCSLLKQESEDQITKFLALNNNKDPKNNIPTVQMKTLPFTTENVIPGFADCIDENGWLRVLPGTRPRELSHVDGFFVARLQKVY